MEGVEQKESPEAPDENALSEAPGELCGKPTPYPEHPCFLPKDHDGFCQAEAYWCIDHSAPRIAGVCIGCVKATVGSMAWDIDELRDDYNRLEEQIRDHLNAGIRQPAEDDAASARNKSKTLRLLLSFPILVTAYIHRLAGKPAMYGVLDMLDKLEQERLADMRVEYERAKDFVVLLAQIWDFFGQKGGSNGDES